MDTLTTLAAGNAIKLTDIDGNFAEFGPDCDDAFAVLAAYTSGAIREFNIGDAAREIDRLIAEGWVIAR